MMNKPKLHFQRFEFKYLLTPDLEKEIKKRISAYVKRDSYVENSQTGVYEVVSLYYDSPGFFYYKQKMDGVLNRKKIRLRTYKVNGEFIPYAFFEIKRRHDSVILKDRFVIPKEDCAKLVYDEDFYGTSVIQDQNRRNIIEEFEWEQHLRSISPKILVSYEREPFLGKYNENFRVTFDRKIKAMANDNLFYAGSDMLDVSGDYTVMEVKFNGSLPFYVDEVIKEFNLQRISYSKYCNAVDVCGSLSVFDFAKPFGISQIRENMAEKSKITEKKLSI